MDIISLSTIQSFLFQVSEDKNLDYLYSYA